MTSHELVQGNYETVQPPAGLSYARARLYLGIVNVGFWVLVSAVGLLAGLPNTLFPTTDTDPNETSTRLALIVIGYIIINLPFDYIGGYALPRRFHRSIDYVPGYLLKWLRGVLVQGVVMYLTAMLLVTAGKQSHSTFLVAVLVAIVMAILMAAQDWFARLVSGFKRQTIDLEPVEKNLKRWGLDLPENTVIYGHADASFSGALAGPTGMEKLILPAKWLSELTPEQLAVQIVRRIGAVQRESRARGVWLAGLWNFAGFWIAASLAGGAAGVSSARGLFETILYFNLWAFLGLLVLPSLSRPGVYEVDRFAREQGVPEDLLGGTIEMVDKLQDSEPEHNRWIEMIFLSIPSVNNRLLKLSRKHVRGANFGAWQSSRMALYLSWACLSFLSRTIPSMVGKTEMWVMPPSD
jgi:hypothetical protein